MKKDFEACWNHYFYTSHPLYELYKKLHSVGADLNYIEFLRQGVQEWDELTKEILAQIKEIKKTKKLSLAPLPKRPPLLIQLFGMEILNAIAQAQKHNPTLSGYSLSEEYGLFIEKPWKVLKEGQKLTRRINQKLVREKLQRQDIPNPSPVTVFMDCANRLTKDLGAGRKPDPGGNLFLLAVSEHLREETDNPQYLLAVKLLKRIRGRSLGENYNERKTATERVRALKEGHPGWRSLLSKLKKAYKSRRRAI